jgi:hypothetical protein
LLGARRRLEGQPDCRGIDYAQLRDSSDVHFPDAAKIVLVRDNLNTHKPAALYVSRAKLVLTAVSSIHQPDGIKHTLLSYPTSACSRHICSLLLGRLQAFFLGLRGVVWVR